MRTKKDFRETKIQLCNKPKKNKSKKIEKFLILDVHNIIFMLKLL